jgi:hypothetical protein
VRAFRAVRETLVRRRKERLETLDSFRGEAKQLGRSEHFQDLKRTAVAVAQVLAESVQTEAAALDESIVRILDCAHVVALSHDVLRNSFQAREQFDFQQQDSVVFASVDWYVNQRGKAPSIFANRNSKDFSTAKVKAHFAALNCKQLFTFADTVGIIERRPEAQ